VIILFVKTYAWLFFSFCFELINHILDLDESFWFDMCLTKWRDYIRTIPLFVKPSGLRQAPVVSGNNPPRRRAGRSVNQRRPPQPQSKYAVCHRTRY